MRIALYFNTPSGGAKRSIYEWVRRLVRNHTIDVYTLSSADHVFCDLRPHVNKYEIYQFSTRKLFNSPLGRLNQLQRWKDLGDLEKLNRQIAYDINNGGYDILFANTCIFTFIPSVMQYVKIPSVYYIHEPFGSSFVRKIKRPYDLENSWNNLLNQYDPLIKLYQKRLNSLQRRNAKRTTRLLANSRFTREWINTTIGVDAPISILGVDIIKFRPETEIQREDFVISVGELSPRKGFDFVVESLGYIPSERRPSLKLACNNILPLERRYVEQLASKVKVDLEVLSGLGADELRCLYNRARLCVYAPVLEPFGLVPLESMACGTPVVGVREGGVQESIVHRKTGLLVNRTPAEFGANVEFLIVNQDLAAEYGRNGREHVLNNWTLERSVNELERHLQDCSKSK